MAILDAKPLIRYTIGPVAKTGWDVLSESLRHISKVYPEFDTIICHNKMNSDGIAKLKSFGVPLLKQDDLPKPFDFLDDDEGRKRNFCWKLVPPRIRLSAHELWVDNDIVIKDRFPTLDQWLCKSTTIISSGFNRDYGVFEPEVLYPDACCAGFFGLPPDFNLENKILSHVRGRKLRGFDEQGLVSLIATSEEGFIVVPQSQLTLLSERWKIKGIRKLPAGMHFARSNRFDNHIPWRYYKLFTTPI